MHMSARRGTDASDTHMTISFSYAYLKGFERLMVSSLWVQMSVQRPSRAISPRMTAPPM